MTRLPASCVLLADRHHQLIERVRDMLETEFATLFIVASETSLTEGVSRLRPDVAVVELSLLSTRLPEVLRRIRASSPETRVLLLSAHAQDSVVRWALDEGADGVVLTRSIATDLLPAIDAMLEHRPFLSSGIARPPANDDPGATSSES